MTCFPACFKAFRLLIGVWVISLVCASSGYAQVSAPSILGDWDIETTYGGQTNRATLTVSKNGDGLSAVLTNADGVLEVHEFSYADGVMKWSIVLPQLGNEPLWAEVHVDGDTLGGVIVASFGEITIRGGRLKEKVVATLEDLLGVWDVAMDFAGRESISQATFSQGDEGLAAEVSFGPMKMDAFDISFADGVAKWHIRVPQFGGDPIAAEARITGATMEGEYVAPFGSLAFKATKRRGGGGSDAAAIESPDEIVGAWELVVNFGGQENKSVATFSLADDKLALTIEGDAGSIDGEDVSFSDGTVKWALHIPQLGEEPLLAEAAVKDGSMEGTYTAAAFGEIPFAGVRVEETQGMEDMAVSEAGDDPASILGTWDVITDINGQGNEGTIILTLVNDKLAARMTYFGGGFDGFDVAFKGGVVSWAFKVSQLGPDPVRITATFDGDSLEGTVATPFGEFPLTGSRQVEEDEVSRAPVDPLDAVVGEWAVTTQYDGRVNTSTLVFEKKDGGLAAVYTGDLGRIEAKDVSFDNATIIWGLPIPQLGRAPLMAKATVSGDVMEGRYSSEFGEVELRGERKRAD